MYNVELNTGAGQAGGRGCSLIEVRSLLYLNVALS